MLICENVDIWSFVDKGAIGIPTNGYVTRNGAGVMGAGLALEAKNRYSGIVYSLGTHLRTKGNIVGWIQKNPHQIIAIPVKPVSLTINTDDDAKEILSRVKSIYSERPVVVPGYHCKASIQLIEQSLTQLVDFIKRYNIDRVFIPLLGCGNGGLSPNKDLFPLLERLNLPDKIVLVTPF